MQSPQPWSWQNFHEACSNAENKQISFQERVVRQVLKRAGVTTSVAVLKKEAQEKHGSSTLDFKWFEEEFPHFPVKLFSEKFKATHQITLGQIYGRGEFEKLAWWQSYLKLCDTYQVDLRKQRAALFFNLPYAQSAFLMVLHNHPSQANAGLVDAEYREDEAWPRTTFPMRKRGMIAVLESFDSFLQTLGTDWFGV